MNLSESLRKAFEDLATDFDDSSDLSRGADALDIIASEVEDEFSNVLADEDEAAEWSGDSLADVLKAIGERLEGAQAERFSECADTAAELESYMKIADYDEISKSALKKANRLRENLYDQLSSLLELEL